MPGSPWPPGSFSVPQLYLGVSRSAWHRQQPTALLPQGVRKSRELTGGRGSSSEGGFLAPNVAALIHFK